MVSVTMKKFLIVLLLITKSTYADFYLSGGIGMHASNWPKEQPISEESISNPCVRTGHMVGCTLSYEGYSHYLGGRNPLGRFKLGYKYKFNRIFSADIYGEHTSSVFTKKERGNNFIMLEGTINLSELFK